MSPGQAVLSERPWPQGGIVGPPVGHNSRVQGEEERCCTLVRCLLEQLSRRSVELRSHASVAFGPASACARLSERFHSPLLQARPFVRPLLSRLASARVACSRLIAHAGDAYESISDRARRPCPEHSRLRLVSRRERSRGVTAQRARGLLARCAFARMLPRLSCIGPR